MASSWMRLSPQNRALISDVVQNSYTSEKCGVCETDGADVCWRSPISNSVHKRCFEKIVVTERKLVQTICALFKKEGEFRNRFEAHVAGVKAVKLVCGALSLENYMDEFGAAAITELFNTVGVQAAHEYATLLQLNPKASL